MNYPIEILPNPNFKFITCDLSDYILIRHTPNKNNYDEEVELVYDKAICEPSSTHMPDLSTSLLGIFVVEFIVICIVNRNYNGECEPDIEVDIPEFEKDFKVDNDRGYYFIRIKDIDGIVVNYNIEKDTFEAICNIKHTPCKWNYWHFSVRWFLPKENKFWNELEDKARKKNWSDRLAHETRSVIRQFAKIEIDENIDLNEDCYLK